MKSVLIIFHGDPLRNPRPNRMIHCLKDEYRVTVIAENNPNFKNVEFFPLIHFFRNFNSLNLVKKIKLAILLKLQFFESLLWTKETNQLKEELMQNSYDLIICEDMHFLPLVFSIKKNAKILVDAQEYYPRWFEDQLGWRFFLQDFYKYICAKYLNKCDRVITVSEGFSQEYYKQYGVKSDIILSLPYYYQCSPSLINPDNIKLIFHGGVSPSRKTQLMIEMMDYVDKRFTLDLMLMPNTSRFFRWLRAEAKSRQNVRIIPPVSFSEIVPFTNKYDIGLFIFPPTNFNIKYTIPNKIFEFIQARLAVAISPTPGMKKIVDEWDCGIISENFEPESLARKLNKLTVDKIKYYKEQSDRAAKVLNYETIKPKIKEIVQELIGI